MVLKPDPEHYLFEQFELYNSPNNWIPTKASNYTGRFAINTTDIPQPLPGERMLFAQTDESNYLISRPFQNPILSNSTFILQFETRFQEGMNCGHVFLNIYDKDNFIPQELTNSSIADISFGLRKCGKGGHVYFSFRDTNIISGRKHKHNLHRRPSIPMDLLTHLYTLVIKPTSKFRILIDNKIVLRGSFDEDFTPPLLPPVKIDDPAFPKPAGWDDRYRIPDPKAKKPKDWPDDVPEYVPDKNADPPEGWLLWEPETIPDPDAKPPPDWIEEYHGKWEPPQIPNPKCIDAPGCGEFKPPLVPNSMYAGPWEPPLITNPRYQGPWKPPKIPNPEFTTKVFPHHFYNLTGVGIEMSTTNKGVGFKNIYIGYDEKNMHMWNRVHFEPKKRIQNEEWKEMHPPTPEPTPEPEQQRIVPYETPSLKGALKNITKLFGDSWSGLYHENESATIVFTFLFFMIPLVGIFAYCSMPSTEQLLDQAPQKMKTQ